MDSYGITKQEVHNIEFTIQATEGKVTLESLERFVTRLKENGFVDVDKVDVFGVSTNQKAHLVAKRSVLYDYLSREQGVVD